MGKVAATLIVLTWAGVSPVHADEPVVELDLAIQPVLSANATHDRYLPLARYLSEITGYRINLVTSPNFVAYWQGMLRSDRAPDLALDASHFTGYRAKYMGYKILARIPDKVSYSLVTRDDDLVMDPNEIIAEPIASFSSPGMGAVLLDRMFPSVFRKPVVVEMPGTEDAIRALREERVRAAFIPSRLVGSFPGLFVVATTEQHEAPALSAAPSVSIEARRRLAETLLNMQHTEAGRLALEQSAIERFDTPTEDAYLDDAKLLTAYWPMGPHRQMQ
ncbi:MAG: PhnD/SsuA/transferrin family substrate-binding protein [Gammaproteobacteria bacterium]|nr:PhnD/SsuA/transferrin family substrate-binding protein [Gammaproteobacteria bacterium]MCP5136802.1 PhnD/SsuA/transferrin family substrate-binding protein [Gammaproteobacteria bacterium]